MNNSKKRLWQVFVNECRDYFLELCSPLLVIARWLRRRTRK
jgi:hypothetical protein